MMPSVQLLLATTEPSVSSNKCEKEAEVTKDIQLDLQTSKSLYNITDYCMEPCRATSIAVIWATGWLVLIGPIITVVKHSECLRETNKI